MGATIKVVSVCVCPVLIGKAGCCVCKGVYNKKHQCMKHNEPVLKRQSKQSTKTREQRQIEGRKTKRRQRLLIHLNSPAALLAMLGQLLVT